MVALAIAYLLTSIFLGAACLFAGIVIIAAFKGQKPEHSAFWNFLIYLALAWLCAWLGGI